jgi:hypothetical protein
MMNVGPVALREFLLEYVDELDDREATELASADSWADELRGFLIDRVRAEGEAA